jgi:hypothetical protein
MGGVNNGLTLEGLAHRLEALEHENARLRDEVATSRGSDTGRDGVGGVLRTPSAPRADNGAEDGGASHRSSRSADGQETLAQRGSGSGSEPRSGRVAHPAGHT